MKRTVWTKQHINVLEKINKTGRYIAQRDYIIKDLEEHSKLVLEVYDWYVDKVSLKYKKPNDVIYPIWVSLFKEGTILKSDNYAILKLELDSEIIMLVNISKWSMILNYAYIPTDKDDDIRHKKVLEKYSTTDTKAYMTQFYPQIKREIIVGIDCLIIM